jgi:8-amino-7-oxononanoate synthase
MIANFARSFQFTTAVPFPLVANIRAAYKLISTDIGREARENTQYLVSLFFEEMTSHPLWETAVEKGLLAIPLAKEWESRQFFTHVVTVWTRQKCTYWLYFHLLFSGFNLMPVEHPVVPVNQSRLKVTIHGGNTTAQVEDLVKAIYGWVEEMLEIEEQGDEKVSAAAAKVFNWMQSEGLHGFGMD